MGRVISSYCGSEGKNSYLYNQKAFRLSEGIKNGIGPVLESHTTLLICEVLAFLRICSCEDFHPLFSITNCIFH